MPLAYPPTVLGVGLEPVGQTGGLATVDSTVIAYLLGAQTLTSKTLSDVGGTFEFDNTADHTLQIETSAAATVGRGLFLRGGNGGGGNENGGPVDIRGGTASGVGNGGYLELDAGQGGAAVFLANVRATSLAIGRAAITTSAFGSWNFIDSVTFGNTSADTVSFVGRILSTILAFTNGADHTIQIDPETVAGTAGRELAVQGGRGADASGATPGANGGIGATSAGSGGAGTAVLAAGAGGVAQLHGGDGGTANGGPGGNGGNALIRGGNATGAGTDGQVVIGDSNTSFVAIGSATIPTNVGGYEQFAAMAAPAGAAGVARLYSRTVLGLTTLFYVDSAGTEHPL